MNRLSSTCADNHRGEKHGISKKRSHFLHLLRQKDDVRDICRQLSIPCSLPFLPQTVWLFCTVQSSGRSDLPDIAEKIAIATLALALRKNLCKFNNSDKKRYCERLEKQPLNFFTVYNKYRNLSSFSNSQSAEMERSGMEAD